MIPKLEKFITKINQLTPSKMAVILAESLDGNKEIIADLITDQLSEGIDGDGDNLAEYASDEYASFKSSIGSKSSPVADLKLTGDYHSSIGLQVSNKSAAIISTDNKDEELTNKYGDKIKQLTEESKIETREQIKPDMQLKINTFLFNKK